MIICSIKKKTSKLLDNHLEHNKKRMGKKWKSAINVHLLVKETLVVFRFKVRMGDITRNV
jgi:hypothetical protein